MVSQEGVFCSGIAKICKFTDDFKTKVFSILNK